MKLHLPILITGLLAARANAWAVAFYSGANCNSDASFNNVNYEGFSQGGDDAPYSSCTVVGDAVDGCTQVSSFLLRIFSSPESRLTMIGIAVHRQRPRPLRLHRSSDSRSWICLHPQQLRVHRHLGHGVSLATVAA